MISYFIFFLYYTFQIIYRHGQIIFGRIAQKIKFCAREKSKKYKENKAFQHFLTTAPVTFLILTLYGNFKRETVYFAFSQRSLTIFASYAIYF